MTIALSMTPPKSPYAGILRRSVIVALTLGSVLTLANQPAAVLGNEPLRLIPMAINFATPLLVVALSQWLATRAANTSPKLAKETPLQTARRHRIPIRALLISAAIGSLNAGILATANGPASLTPILLLQIYGLPLIFSTLSQTVAFRRATN